jgi:hypothetical protein
MYLKVQFCIHIGSNANNETALFTWRKELFRYLYFLRKKMQAVYIVLSLFHNRIFIHESI